MKWAVEQSYFDSGQIRIRVREANEGERSSSQEMTRCYFYIDVFDSEKEAVRFANKCREQN